jgi:hypothetical protein
MYLITPLQGVVKSIFMYILLIIFMQPIVIFISAAGVMFLQALPQELLGFFPALYVALMLIIILVAVGLMIGFSTISKIITTAAKGY